MDESPVPTELRTSPDSDGSAKKGKGKGKGKAKGSPKEKGSPKGSAKEKGSPKGSAKGKGSPKGSAKGKGSPKGSAKGKPKSPVKKEEEPDLSMASMDVTAENPYKLIKKEDIINDIKTRAAISDFHPIKKVVLPPEPEEEEEVKEGVPEEVYKPPVRKPWVSLGSEKEIEEESVRESIRRIKYMISRPHKEFGIRVKFQNRNATLDKHAYVDCMPYQDKNFTIRQLEKHIGVQVVPEEQNTGTQTKWTYPKNATTQYYPREFTEYEKEGYLSSEELKNFIVSVALRVEIALQQNEIMNVFFDDWKALAEEESGFAGKSDVTMKEYQSFTDLHYLKDRTLMLECPEDVYCFEFSPNDPNIIVGGCLNGQVVLWDISEYEERLKSAKSGTAAGTTVNVVNRMGTVFENRAGICVQLMTCSPDCQGDKTAIPNKQSKETPIEKIPYAEIQGTTMKPLKLLENINTSFFVGTEDGEVLYSDWKMERDGDSGRLLSQKPSNVHSIHDGLVHTVQRSPFFKDIILTIGGWNFAIWKEGVTSGPLLKSNCAAKRYTVGHWSLSRPGVFFIGREDGNVDIWDLLEKTHEASQTQNISIAHITCVKPWIYSSKQHFLAVADDFGTLHILEISWSLIHPSSNEREVKHLEYFEQRQEFREQERLALEYEKLMKRTKVVGGQRELMEEQTNQNYVEFLDLEKAILVRLGLIKGPDKFSPSRNM
ncbi:hypothetical protein E2320_010439 [Naja naja]|nr:hypothetical protein E2320_010439 [Naja naja]